MSKRKRQCSSPLHEWCDPINESSYLYRTQYLVVSRTLLEAMPKEWQHRFVELLDEIGEEFDFMHENWKVPHYQVRATDENGKYMHDPWGNYRYPNEEWIEQFRIKKPNTPTKQ